MAALAEANTASDSEYELAVQAVFADLAHECSGNVDEKTMINLPDGSARLSMWEYQFLFHLSYQQLRKRDEATYPTELSIVVNMTDASQNACVGRIVLDKDEGFIVTETCGAFRILDDARMEAFARHFAQRVQTSIGTCGFTTLLVTLLGRAVAHVNLLFAYWLPEEKIALFCYEPHGNVEQRRQTPGAPWFSYDIIERMTQLCPQLFVRLPTVTVQPDRGLQFLLYDEHGYCEAICVFWFFILLNMKKKLGPRFSVGKLYMIETYFETFRDRRQVFLQFLCMLNNYIVANIRNSYQFAQDMRVEMPRFLKRLRPQMMSVQPIPFSERLRSKPVLLLAPNAVDME